MKTELGIKRNNRVITSPARDSAAGKGLQNCKPPSGRGWGICGEIPTGSSQFHPELCVCRQLSITFSGWEPVLERKV